MLDALLFSVANLQTGFGPFLAVFLTSAKWTQTDIGLVLSITGVASVLLQVPMGWIVDRARSVARTGQIAVVGIGISALIIATTSSLAWILGAKLLHVASSAMLGPSITVLTLAIVGQAALAPRLGRNASFAAMGNAVAALGMGLIGSAFTSRAVFIVTAILAVPAFVFLRLLEREPAPYVAPPAPKVRGGEHLYLRDREFLCLWGGLLLFHFANGAMLPLAGSDLAVRTEGSATLFIALCIIGPQLVAAFASPHVGNWAATFPRACYFVGFLALPLRGAILALSPPPFLIVVAQLLDGLSAAVLAVMVPFSLARIAARTGHYALMIAVVGIAAGIGGAASSIVAGIVADRVGFAAAFSVLAGIAIAATAVVMGAYGSDVDRTRTAPGS